LGRLFWKFFFFIWLAQLVTILGVCTPFFLEHREYNKRLAGIDRSPPANFLVESAAATMQYGGILALRSLLENKIQAQIFALDEQNHELLGRQVPLATIERVRQLVNTDPVPYAVRKVQTVDGHAYVLFLPMPENWRDGPPPFGGPPPHDGPPPQDGLRPPPGGPNFQIVPIIAAMLASLVSAALLAWYFSKPIRNLRTAFEAAATGNLQVRLEPVMGKRRDELADLGRNFDLMASHLSSLMESQQRLLHDVSHELRSPLARLQAAIGLARQQPENLEASLVRIERESVRMDKLVGELLSLSRLEAGVMDGLDEEISMHELVSDIVRDAHFEADACGRAVDFSGDCVAVIKGNAGLLHRAIENVVRNAVKHSPEGGRVSVECRVDTQEHKVRLSIIDQGPGIPEQELDEIFKPFFRGNGTKSTDGHGLGLAIASHVFEAHKGSISASNRAGGGLCVEIVLPVAS
jgi:two-component system OmpR family sensor kinase